MSKHTKGPWKVHSNGIAVFTQDDSRCLAIAPTDADASLIAAAPELLEACKQLLKVDRLQCKNSKCTCVQCGLVNNAKQAIAKAEDKQ